MNHALVQWIVMLVQHRGCCLHQRVSRLVSSHVNQRSATTVMGATSWDLTLLETTEHNGTVPFVVDILWSAISQTLDSHVLPIQSTEGLMELPSAVCSYSSVVVGVEMTCWSHSSMIARCTVWEILLWATHETFVTVCCHKMSERDGQLQFRS